MHWICSSNSSRRINGFDDPLRREKEKVRSKVEIYISSDRYALSKEEEQSERVYFLHSEDISQKTRGTMDI